MILKLEAAGIGFFWVAVFATAFAHVYRNATKPTKPASKGD